MIKYVIICIVITAVVTFFTRALPFLIFQGRKEIPQSVKYLGNTLPPCVMIVLVVYCLRDIDVLNYPYGAPELFSAALAVGCQWFFKNTYLSIVIATVVFMILTKL